MSIKIKRNLISKVKYPIKCPYRMTPAYLTIHNTYNDASAANEVAYMRGNNSKTGFHYAVDDKEAVQGIPTNRNAWHAGDGNGNGNRKSIGIEICYSKSGGKRFDAAEKNGAELAARLLHSKGWGIDRLRCHKDWSGKYCPHRTLDRGWSRFKRMVQVELDALKGKKAPSKPTVPKPILVKGDRGDRTLVLQEMLNWFISKKLIGVTRLVLDRSFGPLVKKALKIWQKAAKKKGYYKGKVDGSYGLQSEAAAIKWLKVL